MSILMSWQGKQAFVALETRKRAFLVRYFNFARCTDDFNGAQCKAVCVEAGMIALRREATVVTHEDFMDGILEVQAKKKQNLNYYA
jgi:26S proteasome regulatory subunit T5